MNFVAKYKSKFKMLIDFTEITILMVGFSDIEHARRCAYSMMDVEIVNTTGIFDYYEKSELTDITDLNMAKDRLLMCNNFDYTIMKNIPISKCLANQVGILFCYGGEYYFYKNKIGYLPIVTFKMLEIFSPIEFRNSHKNIIDAIDYHICISMYLRSEQLVNSSDIIALGLDREEQLITISNEILDLSRNVSDLVVVYHGVSLDNIFEVEEMLSQKCKKYTYKFMINYNYLHPERGEQVKQIHMVDNSHINIRDINSSFSEFYKLTRFLKSDRHFINN